MMVSTPIYSNLTPIYLHPKRGDPGTSKSEVVIQARLTWLRPIAKRRNECLGVFRQATRTSSGGRPLEWQTGWINFLAG